MIRRQKVEVIQHAIIALLLLMGGIDHLTLFPVVGLINLIAGAVIIAYIIYQRFNTHKNPAAKAIVMIIEGIALMLVSWLYFQSGKQFLPYAYLIAGVLYFISAFLVFRRKKSVTGVN